MATIKQIQFKRSNVAGKRPLPADIAEGELAINIKDSTLFTKNADGQIIDLGFAKGGRIDGDVIQVGSYTQTGNYTTSGDISARNLSVTTGVNAGGEVRSSSGVFRTRAGGSSNSHIWFEGEEVAASKNYERGVLYAAPQTASAGQINLRVLNGSAVDSGQALFVWNGAGDFAAPRDVLAQRARLSIEAVAPTFNGSRFYTRDRTWNQFGSNESYGWNDLVNYTVGQNGALALNYVYKGRAHSSGTIWHNLIDERDGAEWTLYTGAGPTNKMFALRSAGVLGHAQFTGSLFLGPGGGGLGTISGMGQGSLALGDNDTGFRSDGDGMFSIMANSRALIHYNAAAPKFQIEHRKATRITHTDNTNTTILPTNNASLLEIDTSLDGNNAGGNGLTLLGYNSSGKYYHYFRGTGYVAYDMDQGVNINKGGLTVGGNAFFSNTLTANAGVVTAADYSLRGPSSRHIRFEYLKNDGSVAVDAYFYKDGVDNPTRRSGLRINCGTPNKASGNTSNSGDFIFGEDGTFTLPGGGTIVQDGLNQNVYCMSALSTTATGSKNYLRKFRGGNADTVWHETVQGGVYRLATGNTDAQQEFSVSNAGDVSARRNITAGGSANISGDVNADSEVLAKGGSIRVRSSSNGTAHFWFQNAAGIERGVIYAENNANSVKLRANRSDGGATANSTWSFGFDGVLAWNGQANISGSGTCVYATTQLNGSDTGIIRGNPGAGGHADWEARSSAVQIDCPSSDNAATNVWKATKWGAYHIAAMDVYAPGGNAYVRLVLRGGGAHIWNNSGYTSPVQINAPEFYLTSDVSLKKDIRSIEDSRSNLHKVEIKRYAMKDGSNDNAIGVIAQEVQKVYPELVSENKNDGKLSVNYRGLSSVLWKIVQEQDKELEDIKTRLARIEELLSK